MISNSPVINQKNKQAFDIKRGKKKAKEMLWGKGTRAWSPQPAALPGVFRNHHPLRGKEHLGTAKLIFNLLESRLSY